MFRNKNLLIIALIAIVNALGYGIIIPILYSYSLKYGLSDFQNGLLFSVFSIFQFLSTPLIGRLSDKYGRRPLLIISLAGTAISFLMMAFAPNALFLFLARALDGLTAGNIPVASAVISDTTSDKDRAKGFGVIGASFGFGFIFGPAISAFTLPFGDSVPFLIAALVTIIAVVLTAALLPETNMHKGEVKKGKIFDMKHLIQSVFDKQVGTTLLISFVYFFAFGLFIYSYQPFSVRVLGLSAQAISLNFTLFGVVGLLAQTIIIPRVTKRFGDNKSLTGALVAAVITFLSFYFTRSYIVMILVSAVHSLANSFVQPLTQALLSKETDAKSQGSIMGLQASYMSLGLIIGPIVGGALASLSVPMPFIGGSFLVIICVVLSLQIPKRLIHNQHAF